MENKKEVMQSFLAHEGWDILKSHLDELIEARRDSLEEIDSERNVIKFTSNDLLRIEIDLIRKLRNDPESIYQQENPFNVDYNSQV